MLAILTVVSANTKHLYTICTMLDQLRRRWADVVQMLYNFFVFSGRGFLGQGHFQPWRVWSRGPAVFQRVSATSRTPFFPRNWFPAVTMYVGSTPVQRLTTLDRCWTNVHCISNWSRNSSGLALMFTCVLVLFMQANQSLRMCSQIVKRCIINHWMVIGIDRRLRQSDCPATRIWNVSVGGFSLILRVHEWKPCV